MRGQSRTITRLSNENSELQGKLDLAQRKISKLLELAQLGMVGVNDLLEIEFAQVEHARYLLVLVGNALAGDVDRRELYYELLGQIETLERRVSELRAELARSAPISAVVTTMANLGITLDPTAFTRLKIELAELAREAV